MAHLALSPLLSIVYALEAVGEHADLHHVWKVGRDVEVRLGYRCGWAAC